MLYFDTVIIMKNKIRGTITLLFTTLIWGSAFIAQSVGMDHIGPMTFQAIRSALAVSFLFVVAFFFHKDKKNYFKSWADPRLWKAGITCGLSLFVASGLQQVGLVYASVGKAGFITALYIVSVPIFGLFLHRKPPLNAWISVLIAVAGLYLLSWRGSGGANFGDLCLLGSAITYGIQIILIDLTASDFDGPHLNCIQSLVCGVLSALVMVFTETPTLPNIISCTIPLCYAGILSMGVAYTLQIVGQKDLDPTPAALIMSLESVFAALCGWLILNERMTPSELCGCALVFGAVILSQLPEKKKMHG